MPRLLDLTNTLFLIFVASLFLFISTAGVYADSMSKIDKAMTRQVIEKYIKDNPEVIRDALLGLASHEKESEIKAGIEKVRLDSGDPIMGNENGRIVVYEFTDYNCGYCKRMFAPIQKILANNDDVRMVIKEFPILSQSSVTAARAGIAAQKQGKFSLFHNEMMSYRGQINNASIMTAAGKSGLDLYQLQQDMDSPATTAIIERTRTGAAALSLNGTPAFIIGETIIPGAISADELQSAIDRERSKQN